MAVTFHHTDRPRGNVARATAPMSQPANKMSAVCGAIAVLRPVVPTLLTPRTTAADQSRSRRAWQLGQSIPTALGSISGKESRPGRDQPIRRNASCH